MHLSRSHVISCSSEAYRCRLPCQQLLNVESSADPRPLPRSHRARRARHAGRHGSRPSPPPRRRDQLGECSSTSVPSVRRHQSHIRRFCHISSELSVTRISVTPISHQPVLSSVSSADRQLSRALGPSSLRQSQPRVISAPPETATRRTNAVTVAATLCSIAAVRGCLWRCHMRGCLPCAVGICSEVVSSRIVRRSALFVMFCWIVCDACVAVVTALIV